MIQKIFCPACAADFPPLDPDDAAEGWKLRRVEITAKKPADHSVKLISIKGTGVEQEHIDLPSICCDACNDGIPDGTKAVCLTMWRGKEPENWEKEYSQ